MRTFGYVRHIDGNQMLLVQTDRMETVAVTNFQNRDWILAALNYFAQLSPDEQKRLTHDQAIQEG